jgi:hypothetical protein
VSFPHSLGGHSTLGTFKSGDFFTYYGKVD